MSLSTSRSAVRVNIRDNSSTAANQAFADADIHAKLNDAYRLVSSKFYPRIVRQSASQTGISLSSTTYIALTTATNYSRIIAIQASTPFQAAQGAPLPVEAFMSKYGGQNLPIGSGTPAPGPHIAWTAWREATATSANQGKWAVSVYPPPSSTTTYSALVEIEVADLSSDSDTFDLPTLGITMVEHLASYWLASILGRESAAAFISQWPELKEGATERRKDAGRGEGSMRG